MLRNNEYRNKNTDEIRIRLIHGRLSSFKNLVKFTPSIARRITKTGIPQIDIFRIIVIVAEPGKSSNKPIRG